jgi:undecaprenyl-phosphate 4-deoxy-4-formamido-L-arabinose transferase
MSMVSNLSPDINPMKSNDLTVSVVVPVFNSEGTLDDLIQRLRTILKEVAAAYEVILVNDGSRDGSWQVIQRLAQNDLEVHGINLMRNYGQHNALLAGIRAAKYEIVVTLDDDLQNPPEEIPKLLEKLFQGYDVVFGKPAREQHGFLRDLASQVTKIVLKRAMGADVARNVSAFRVFRTRLREAFSDFYGPFVSIDVLLTWGTTRFATVEVRHDARKVGNSTYTLPKLITHAFNMMTGFSVVPLQIASMVGFGFTLFGIGVLSYVLLRYLFQGSPVPGFPFLASIIAIFSGAQLFALGIIGEYLARMYFRTMNKPAYVIRESIKEDGKAE